MNVYAVCIPEERANYSYEEPPEVGVPLGIFAAETRGQAKIDALGAWTHRPMGVYCDDFPSIRARKLYETHSDERGEVAVGHEAWLLWPDGWPEIGRVGT